MTYNQNIFSKTKLCSQNLSTAYNGPPGKDFQNMLQLLSYSDDLDLLVKIFSTLGLLTLSKNTMRAQIIKCEAVYRKLVLVLKSGSQTKTLIALKLISAILYLDDEGGITKNKTLHFYAKNMIRISGCLTTMTDLFTSFMMHQDTWKALCRSIRDTCNASVTNQSHCSHLVPLCIQRCLRGSLEPILLLHSLLANHHRNIKLFHDNNGMTIFTRESLHHPACLLLLNTIIESTNPHNQCEILNASHLFRELQYHMHKYGLQSSVGKWVSIVLYSHRKVFGSGKDEEQEKENVLNNETITRMPHSTYNIRRDNNSWNETSELFRNILNEVGWQKHCDDKSFKSACKKRNYDDTNSRFCDKNQPANGGWHPTESKLFKDTNKYETSNHFRTSSFKSNNNVSFSFLFSQNEKELQIPNARNEIGCAVRPEVLNNNKNDKGTNKSARYVQERELKRSIKNKLEKTVEEFKPLFVSTPKRKNLNSKEKTMFQTITKSFRSSTRDHIKGDNGKTKLINTKPTYKKIRNKSFSAKLFDIVNESCTTLIKGFKNIFKPKNSINLSKESITTFVKQDNSCNNTFTHHISNKDEESNKGEEWTNFTKQYSTELSNFELCKTCNDTVIIKDKLAKDVTLQRTMKKLKLGINLYGCDFKKISKTMWPHEAYMTPNVLYNLYRKVILKQ